MRGGRQVCNSRPSSTYCRRRLLLAAVMGCTFFAIPVYSIVGTIVFITCGMITLSGIVTSLDIFNAMGISSERHGDQIYYFALALFSTVGVFDLIMLAYTWYCKLAIREAMPFECGPCCMGLFFSEIFVTIVLALYWASLIVLVVICLIIPLLAALLFASTVLCDMGDEGVGALMQLSASLPGLDFIANATAFISDVVTPDAASPSMPPMPMSNDTSYPPPTPGMPPPPRMPPPPFPPSPPNMPPPFPPPLMPPITPNGTLPLLPGNGTTPEPVPGFCDLAMTSAANAAMMLFSCAPLLVISQMMVLTSASTVIYAVVLGNREGGGRSKTGDIQFSSNYGNRA